ncbi:alpha-(1,4)-fucosyltransferase-like [Canna indica]|uniref:Fucosyltransferase n=1 Tax=Canna indica TaxID=4628 RepID=A0AAQ3QKW4_9LILI|nr:alpha-(1,4)-fucosyltransferase-like [Canna indica]
MPPVSNHALLRFLPSSLLLLLVLLFTSSLDFSSLSSPLGRFFSSSHSSASFAAARPVANPAPAAPPVPAPAPAAEAFTDLAAAFKRWDEEVGCERFREKHRNWTAPDPSAIQDAEAGDCSTLGRRRHVSILVKRWSWIPDEMDNLYSCRCGLSCLWSKSQVLADDPDALFFEWDSPPKTRKKGEPLRIFMDIEPTRKPTGFEDIFVGYHAKDDVQCTYAASIFHKLRNYHVSNEKRNDALVYWSSSRCFQHRNDLAKELFAHITHHSFGGCLNNVGGTDAALSFYPECKMEMSAKQHWWEHIHCAMSHYKFVLAIENTKTDSYISEKLYFPLEAGAVPIYFGAPDVANFVPPHSIIDGSKFNSVEELAAYVKAVADDPIAYAEYHAWRRCGVMGDYAKNRGTSLDALPCRLCEYISRKGGKFAP